MRSRAPKAVLLSLVASLLLSDPFAFGQSATPEGTRKVLSRAMPIYPDLARKTNVSGTVKLDARIGPDGKVKSTEVIGGNPILVQAAVEAVRKWKFEASAQETTERIELKFSPH